MERTLRVLIFLLTCLVGGFASSSEPQKGTIESSTATMVQAFRWFDTLGYPNFRNRRFISVELQQWLETEDNPTGPPKIHGFLLTEDESRFKVLMLDLSEREYEKPTQDGSRRWTAKYTDANFETVAAERLKELTAPGDRFERIVRHLGDDTSTRTQLFVLARASDALGYPRLTQELMAQALATRDHQTGEQLEYDQFQEKISDDLGNAETWRCYVDFGDPQVSREELLTRFRWIARHFPAHRHKDRVNSTIELLSKMVAEDRDHAAQVRTPLEEMPLKQRVAELIFQLRDQNGMQFSQPGCCDIFADPRDDVFGIGKEDAPRSPAAQLVAIGRPALEQLIDSVDDNRFTRSVEYHRSFIFSHRVIRVGECCHAIMNRIHPTGRVWDSEKDREKAKREMKVWYLGKSDTPSKIGESD